MHHHMAVAAAPTRHQPQSRPPANLGRLVRDQVREIVADGYGEIDIRWNSVVLSIEGQSEDGYLRRIFNCSGACVMEKIDRRGQGVERYYDSDGITLLSEAMFDSAANR